MNGKLGALFRGEKQIGGFLDWEQTTLLNQSTNQDGDLIRKLASWTLTARAYWLFDAPPRDITVRLYLGGKGYWEGQGFISSATRKIFDTLIYEPLDIVGEGILEGKE